MHDTGCPPFRNVMGYLFCIVLSVAMILWLLPGLLAGVLGAWVFFIAFCAIILYGFLRLVQGLFPARFLRCPVCTLVREIIEIDGTVG